jgi:NhaP-type Na+/H+ or K+/H+ antiporter
VRTRGGISLAAALALADQIPSRTLLIFLTACVIAGTLILQGWPLRREGSQARDLERLARMEAIKAAIEELEHSGDKPAHIRDE